MSQGPPDNIRFADTKAIFSLGLATALAGALYAAKAHKLFIGNSPSPYVQQISCMPFLSAAGFILLACSIIAAIAAVGPRLSHSSRGFISWKSISKFETQDEFVSEFQRQSDGKLTESLSQQVFTVSTICEKKFWWINISKVAGIFGAILAVTVLLLLKP